MCYNGINFFWRNSFVRIRPAAETDLNAVAQSYRNQLMYEMENNTSYSNWKFGVYPTTEVSIRAHAKQELYVAETKGRIIGSMILTEKQPKEYKDISWKTENSGKILVVHTLCVPPRHSGKGCGHSMLRYVLELSSDQGYSAVRCNLWQDNQPAKHLLEDMGFYVCGSHAFLPDSLPEETDLFMEYDLTRKRSYEFDL